MEHYIIAKFKDKADIERLVPDIKRLFDKALQLDGVKGIDIYQSNSTKENRYSIMIKMTCTPEGLDRFDASDIHEEWKAVYGERLADKAIFDCE